MGGGDRGVRGARGLAAAAVAAVTALGAAGAAPAGPGGRIDFDDRTVPSLFAETVRLTDAYERAGVRFEGPGGRDGLAVLTEAGNFHVGGHSVPNFLAWNHGARMSDGGLATGPEKIWFAQTVTSIALRAGCHFGGTLTATAYDPGGKKLGSASVELGADLAPLRLAFPAIRSVVLELPPGGEYGVIDDLVWTLGKGPPPAAPPPTKTLGPGAAGLWAPTPSMLQAARALSLLR